LDRWECNTLGSRPYGAADYWYVTLRFIGQVKIPDLDYPGVPAAVVVEGKQLELFVEGESLGRWSLVDVRAERLISSAFSLKLADEEVTFIADQPTEFAYSGVEEMANVWAKHRTMRFPRRAVANSRSRQGTKPSRIGDLRAAIAEALDGAPTALVYGREPVRKAAGVESLRKSPTQKSPAQRESVEDRPPSAPSQPVAGAPPESQQVKAGDPTPMPEPEAPAEHIASDPVPEAPDTPDVVLAEPSSRPASTPPVTDSVFKESVPWAKREEAEVDEEPGQALSAELTPEEVENVPAPTGVDSASDDRTPESTSQPVPSSTSPGSVPWIDPAALGPTSPMPGPDEEEPQSSEAEPVTSEPAQRPPYVVDLGAFEDPGDEEPVDTAPDTVRGESVHADDEPQPELATASARGGIMSAVRSAFVRNRAEHTHEYVEAPGGLGIKRQICAECGHISIGLSQ
jgi:hypothetical protein